MILIITHKSDYTADYLINKLNVLSISYYRLNCEDIDKFPYSINLQNHFNLQFDSISEFDSVWFRRTKLPDLTAIENYAERIYIANEYDALLNNLYDTIKTKKWLSYPGYIYKAENKLYQLSAAKELGFSLPDTLVTNNHSELFAFIKKHDNNVILKPINQGRIDFGNFNKLIYTNKLKHEHIEQLKEYNLTPCIYQQYIDKLYEVRVTVVDSKVFAAKVDSQSTTDTKIDWRKQKLKFTSYILPKEIEVKCISLLKSLNISFGAIDLIKSINNEYYFLEINPNGQWAWIEIDTGLNISEAIINFLTV